MKHSCSQMREITKAMIQYTGAVLPVHKYYGDKTVLRSSDHNAICILVR